MTAEHILREVQASISEDLRVMDEILGTVGSEIAGVLGQEGGELVAATGKRLRSTLMLLCAGMGQSRNGVAPTAAAMAELVHLATLIHDDSIDDSTLRRGRPTAHVTWNHKVATMLGDMLYSRAFELLTELGDMRLLRVMAHATHVMAQGELEEFLLRGTLPLEDTYLRVVHAKTAAFFGACCRTGAILGGVPIAHQHSLARFGESLGTAFQVVDDILDYTAEEEQIGKGMGTDLRDGIMTLPLIAALSRAGKDRHSLLAMVKGVEEDASLVEGIVASVVRHGGIEYARGVALRLCDEARALLAWLPPSSSSHFLDLLAQYVVQRER
ncbi:polyprenyl synthetase family protein [Candidatus Fermentibacteria bacterium]|nr:polyprenyl synthetase family protein [Candidatus Fermentibacteria bacterium]